ncbi:MULTISPECIES: YunG family protein [Sinorhizobium/Ensifer group]|uniref:YunG family protein n=1 Tax=Sinorhizobium alkalisoli TaxID=1752398 RepID=UPI000D093B3F|nr:hypothetical protein [Ensifer sp. NBAIM29]
MQRYRDSASARKSYPIFEKLDAQIQRVTATFARLKTRGAVVVQDLFGGEILKTRTGAGMHFYNRIDGERHDLTLSQFDEPIQFDDVASTRDEAFADTSDAQYRALKEGLDLFCRGLLRPG